MNIREKVSKNLKEAMIKKDTNLRIGVEHEKFLFNIVIHSTSFNNVIWS